MLIDLHTHTSASDGALAPSEIIDRALAAGVELLAITDHDSVAGYRAAAAHYTENAGLMKLVPGVELSCRWSGVTVHVVGLGIDCDHAVLRDGLALLDDARRARAAEIAKRLARHGFSGALEGALEEAGSSQLGRPHFAAWMVGQGHVASFAEAFERYLGQGKTGDVKAFWPELAEVTAWITAAGGVAVMAHPLKYRFTRMKLYRLLMDFSAAGGQGIELVCGPHHPERAEQLRRLAREFSLEISVGSDFHRDTTYGPRLGVAAPPLGELRGVWQRWASNRGVGSP